MSGLQGFLLGAAVVLIVLCIAYEAERRQRR